MSLRQRFGITAVVASLLVGCAALTPESPPASTDAGPTHAVTAGTTPATTGAVPSRGPALDTPPIVHPTLLPSQLATPVNTGQSFKLNVPVLMYHRIRCVGDDTSPKVNPSLRVCPELFEEQLTTLREDGWQTITADELADALAQRQCPGPKTFVISIDDGAIDGYDNAAPIMEKLGFRGTFYVIASRGDDPRRISWDQTRDLLARGHGIGSHSWSHRSVGRGDPKELYVEIEMAQQEFASELGFRPRTFVYPYGSYGPGAIRQLQESNLELAFTTESGGTHSTEEPLLSPRVRVKPTHDGLELVRHLDKWADPCAAAPSPTAEAVGPDYVSRGTPTGPRIPSAELLPT